ncbi:MAG TPA: hypothetical protein VNT79_09925 [Phycisphaerae bacterium]|nr:hypothetical protein [Phycisphaerae bacterium]
MKSESPIEPLAVDAATAARLCGVGRSKWYSMHSAGQTPLPVRVGGGCPRWIVSELKSWLAAGCPARDTWQARRRA